MALFAAIYNWMNVSPLSDREQKILEEIERDLYEGDPKLARNARRSSPPADTRRFKIGLIVLAAGFVLLFGFFISRLVAVGVLAFGAMVAGIVMAAGSVRGLAADRSSASQKSVRLAHALGRWERRIRERYKRT